MAGSGHSMLHRCGLQQKNMKSWNSPGRIFRLLHIKVACVTVCIPILLSVLWRMCMMANYLTPFISTIHRKGCRVKGDYYHTLTDRPRISVYL